MIRATLTVSSLLKVLLGGYHLPIVDPCHIPGGGGDGE